MQQAGMPQPGGVSELQKLVNIQPPFPPQLSLSENSPQSPIQAGQRLTPPISSPQQGI